MKTFMSAKGGSAFGGKKWPLYVFSALVFVSLLTPFWVFRDLMFPYITSKAFFFRIVIEAALPFYLYLLVASPTLRPKLKQPLNLVVLAFLIINIVSAFAGVSVFRSLWGNFERMGGVYYLAHLVLLYFYVLLLGQAGEVYLQRFLQVFILTSLAVTLNGLSGWLGGPILIQDPSLPARVSSTFGNPIFFPSYLIVPMFLAAYFAVGEKKRWLKIFYWLAAALQLIGIYSSGTRGAAVGLIVGLFVAGVVYLVLSKNAKVKRFGFAGIGIFIILAGALLINHDKLKPGSTLYRLANLRDSNTEARLLQWGIALKGFKDRPILGTGPENYYVIFDEHYNPEMYKYDASWFDKPHNFLLEVLTTTGLLGFIAYALMFFFAVWALWKAYRAELIGLMESCLFLAALITYQVQNLTVFDTVSASVAFYAFMGFCAYLWKESSESNSQPVRQQGYVSGKFAGITLAVVFSLMLYMQYISNITSVQAAKRTNYGFAYTAAEPQAAASYFNSALSVPFNLDPRETVNRYSDFANRLVSTGIKNTNLKFVTEQIDKATEAQRSVTESVGNDPLLWTRLAMDVMNQAIVHNRDLDTVEPVIEKAISLSPKRVELLQLRIQYLGYKKDWARAVETAEEIARLKPTDPALGWQVAMARYLSGNVEAAVEAGDRAYQDGFVFTNLQQFAWYIQYYQQKGDFQKVVPLLERAVELEPNELGLYVDLARAYAAIGDIEHAKALARQVMQSNTSQKAAMEEFIKSLK